MKTTEQFIVEAKQIHGDRYDYSKVEYTKAVNKVIIICKKHGEFYQQSNLHLSGSGCVNCFRDRNALLQRCNREQFINKAIQVHGDKYDYSKVVYTKGNETIIIICKEHGEYLQTASKHLQGGCKLCGFTQQAKARSKSKDTFINDAIKVHGDKFDYSKVVYKNNMCKVSIICKEHGEFLQAAGSHLQGHGCKSCSTIITANKQRSNNEEFIEKATEIHGDKYDYSKIDYINSNEKVIIICKEHGEFSQDAKGHIQKKAGCPKCGLLKLRNHFKHTSNIFIKKATTIHGDKYDYSKVIYVNNGREPIIIICKTHGEFTQNPQEHLSGHGCSKCGKVYRKNTIEYIEKAKEIHGDKYDYSKTVFKTAKSKIIIICKEHGDFEQEAYCHSIGVGCPCCVNKTEGKLYSIMKNIYPSLISQFKQEWCRKIFHLPFDFCIQEYKIVIELDGGQHFNQVMNWKPPEEQFENDKFKEDCANNNGYSVIRLLQHDVFYDTYDWVKELCDSIEELKNGDEIANIYLCKNNEYAKY